MSRLGKSECWRLCGGGPSLQLDHVATGQRYSAVPRLQTGYRHTVDIVDTVDSVYIVDIVEVNLNLAGRLAASPAGATLTRRTSGSRFTALTSSLDEVLDIYI